MSELDALLTRFKQEDAGQTPEPAENSDLLNRYKQEDAVLNAFATAAKTNPDEYARLRKKAIDAGMTPEQVDMFPDEAERRSRYDQAVKLAQDSPKTAKWLTESENARLGHDNADNLSGIEQAFQVLKNTGNAAVSGLRSASAGSVGLLRMPLDVAATVTQPLVGTVLPANPFGIGAERLGKWQQEISATAKAEMPKGDSLFSSGVYSGISSLSRNLATLPMAFLPGGQQAALGSMVAPVFGEGYGQARDQGKSITQSTVFGSSQAAIEYATEKLPLTKLLGDLKAGETFLKTLGKQAALEVPGEQIATVLQDLNDWAVLNPDKPFADYIKERPDAAVQTLIATLVGTGGQVSVMQGISSAIGYAEKRAGKAQQAEQQAAFLDNLNKLAASDKLLQRDADSFEAFVAAAAEDGPVDTVFIDGKTLMQSGMAPQLAELSPAVRDQLDRAILTGGDIAIPVAEYAARIAPSELAPQLLDHLKTEADGFTRAEAQDFMANQGAELQAEVERILTDRQDADTFRASQDVVKQDILGQLNTAGRFTPQVNEAYATLASAYSAVRAAQLGMTPEAFHASRNAAGTQRGMKVQGAAVAGQQFSQITPEQAMATNVRQEMPSDPLFTEAVGNTPGAQITENGLLIDLVRYQKPEQEGAQSIRTGVFYLPNGASTAKHYRKKGTLAAGNEYGGSEEFKGQTLVRRPLFVKGATGGKAPETAYDTIKGKGAYQKMRTDVLHATVGWGINEAQKVENVGEMLARYGADPDLAHEIVRNSNKGNLLPYAVQENIVAHAVREAGYDAVVGYSKGKAGANISEVFDVREQTFPAHGMDSEVHDVFNQSGQLATDTPAFKAWFGDSKVVDSDGNPLVVYHGTKNAGFSVFNTDGGEGKTNGTGAFFTTSPLGASTYSNTRDEAMVSDDPEFDPKYDGEAGNYAVYLNIKNPKVIDFEGANWDSYGAQREWFAKNEDGDIIEYFTNEEDANHYRDTNDGIEIENSLDTSFAASTDDLVREARAEGYDGVILKNITDEGPHGQGYGWDSEVYVVFSPEQIKSATQNKGTFDPADPNILNQSAFYSQLHRAIESAPDKVFTTATQFKLWLNSNAAKLGIKKDEVEWSGINDYLDMQGNGKVSKADVVAFLSENGVRVEDVVLGEKPSIDGLVSEAENDLENDGVHQLDDGTKIRKGKTGLMFHETPRGSRDIYNLADFFRSFYGTSTAGNEGTKFNTYTPPGGIPGTYREILVTLPGGKPVPMRTEYQRFDNGVLVAVGSENAAARWLEKNPDADVREVQVPDEGASKAAGNFQSSHFDQPNILVHLRTDEVTGADGKRYLRVVEVQSDWHQSRTQGKEVPDAPFADTRAWVSLGIKRAIQQAVSSGVDGIVFATGQQNADLYDLSKQVDYIDYVKSAPDRYNMAVVGKNGDEVFSENAITIDRVEEVVGKDVATKIANGEGKSGGGRMTLSGLDLKVGGEGMRAFYDTIVPSVANDVLKKLGGGKVGAVAMTEPTASDFTVTRATISGKEEWRVWDADDNVVARYPTEQAARAEADKLNLGAGSNAVTQPGFLIPESLKAKVEEGLALFQPDGDTNRGAFSPATNTVTLLKNADLSTFLHESAHYFFESDIQLASELVGKAELTSGEQQIVDDVSRLLTWHGIQGDVTEQLRQWHTMDFEEQRSHHERTAESFEAYLFSGKAPSLELQPVFQRFAAWMVNVYKSLKDFLTRNPEAGKLNDEVRQVFDRMIATREEIAIAEQARSMMPLFADPAKSGMTPEDYAKYQALGVDATNAAIDELQAKGMRDLQWLANAKGRQVSRLKREARALRAEVEIEARREVMSQPVYRAWDFLTRKLGQEDQLPALERKSDPDILDPTLDSLFVAIAKLGGIKKDQVIAEWGVDPKDIPQSGLFGKPVWRITEGLTLDGMASALAEHGYLPLNEHGQYELNDLGDRFLEELAGNTQYSHAYQQQDLLPGEQIANPAGLGAGRLDLAGLAAIGVPEEVANALKARKMTAKDGLHPDLVASLFNFSSGDEMVRALAAAPTPKESITALADRLMLERHGELATPEAIERAADAAIHNEARARMVATEANALAQATGKPKILASAAKAFAADMISRLKVRDIKPNQYANAGTRAAKAAAKAEKAGDIATAAAEKRNQVINTYATKAAYDAQDEVKATLRAWSKLAARKDSTKSVDIDLLNAVRAILGEYGIAPKRAERAADYLKSVQAYDPEMYAVIQASVERAEANAKPVKDLTLEELRGLRDEIDSIMHLAKRSRQMEVDGNLLDIEDIQGELLGRMQEYGIPDKIPGEGQAVTPAEQRMTKLKSLLAFARRVESWVGQMDGKEQMGPFRRFVWSRISDAAVAYRTDKADYLKRFRGLVESIAPTLKPMLIHAPELGYTFGKDSGGSAVNEILHAILHTGNESNKRKMLLGRGWAVEVAPGQLDTTRWDAFIARMVQEGKITQAHYDFAQGVWDLLDSMKPLAQKTHRDVFGKYFDEVTAAPFTDPFGVTRAGGYVPAMVDSRVVKDAELRKLADEDNAAMSYAFPTTPKGFTQARTEYNKPLMLDLRTLGQHIDKVLLFSHMEMPVRDVQRVLSKQVGETLNRIDQTAISGMLLPWLNRSAKQQVETPIAGSAGTMRFFSVMRSRAGMAAMFGNLANTVQQLTGFSLAAVKVKPGLLLAATADFIKSPREFSRSVAESSPYMNTRMANEVHAMTDAINDILLNPSLLEKGQAWAMRHAYFLQSAMDNTMSPIVWTAAYNQAVQNGADHDDAVRLADGTVRQTQGAMQAEDIARIEGGNAFVRMFTQFAGYFNMNANLLGTEYVKLLHDGGLRKNAGRGVFLFLLGYYVPAIVGEIIIQAFRGGPGDDDDDGEYLDDWIAAVFGWAPLRYATAMVPVGGQAVNAAVNATNSKPYDDRLATSPAISMLESAARAPVSVFKAVEGDGSAQKAVRDVATLITMTLGIPASLAARPLGYGAGVMDEAIDPTGGFDFARGMLTGQVSPDSKQ